MKKKIAQFLRRLANYVYPEVTVTIHDRPNGVIFANSIATYKVDRVNEAYVFPSDPQRYEIEKRYIAEIKERIAQNIGETLYKQGYITFAEDNEPIPSGRDMVVATVFVARKQTN